MNLTRARLETLLSSFLTLNVGVLGDFTLDGYWTADMQRASLSRETPLSNRPVVAERYSPGGAANVAWNLAELGVGVWAFTALGDDWRGAILRRLLADLGIHPEGLLQVDGWQTPFYGKVLLTGYHSQQEDARLDFINPHPLNATAEDRLIASISEHLPRLNALVVADYQTVGVVTPRLVQALNSLALTHPKVLFLVDSRENLAAFHNMVVKPNEVEAARVLYPEKLVTELQLPDYRSGVQELARRFRQPAFITLGEAGCLVAVSDRWNGGDQSIDQQSVWQVPVVKVPPPIDTVGAGDTFSAALVSALAAGATPLEAAQLATLASAVTIRKLGITGAASPEEIRTMFESLKD